MQCRRVEALNKIESTLNAKLAAERTALAAVTAAADKARGSDNKERLRSEGALHAERIQSIEGKLRKARHTLVSLQSAQTDLHSSASKVQSAERALHDSPSPKSGFQTSLRQELQEATGMMAAAARRVEQMESITDLLLEQLGEREGEVAALKSKIELQNQSHNSQIRRLESQRSDLIDQVETATNKAAELEQKQSQLQAQLHSANAEVKKKSQGKKREQQLESQNDALALELFTVKESQEKLSEELKRKEAELANALETSFKGTPKGEGAKKVLPMALARIREAQQALIGEKEESQVAKEEATAAKTRVQELERLLAEEASALQADRDRAVAEKQASLESMTRAAASAAAEAAKKAEIVHVLENQLEELFEERDGLLHDFEESEFRRCDLENELAALKSQLADLSSSHEALLRQYNEIDYCSEEQKSVRQELEKRLAASEEALAAARERGDDLEAESNSYYSQATEFEESSQKQLRRANHLQHELEKSRQTVSELEEEVDTSRRQLERREAVIDQLQCVYQDATEALSKSQTDVTQSLKHVKELQDSVYRLESERDARESETERLRNDLINLATELEVKESEINKAKNAGTPVGEGAKQVLRLSFQRIKALNATVTQHVAAVDAKNKTIEGLKSEIKAGSDKFDQLRAALKSAQEDHVNDVSKLKGELKEAQTKAVRADNASQKLSSKLQKVVNDCLVLDNQLKDNQNQLSSKCVQLKSLEGQLLKSENQVKEIVKRATKAENMSAQLNEKLEVAMKEQIALQMCIQDGHADLMAKLSQIKSLETELATSRKDAQSKVGELESRLKTIQTEKSELENSLKCAGEKAKALELEVASLRASGTPQGNAAKEVVKLSFNKIRDMQDTVEHQALTIRELEAQLECAEDNASQLAAQVTDAHVAIESKAKQVMIVEAELAHAQQEMSAMSQKRAALEQALSEAALEANEVKETLMKELEFTRQQVSETRARAESLEHDLADVSASLVAAQASAQHVEAQKRMVERLRMEIQCQLEEKDAAVACKQIAETELHHMTAKVEDLKAEIVSLRDTVAHLGEAVAVADKSMGALEYAERASEKQWIEALGKAGQERDEASAQKAELEGRLVALESQLADARAEIESARAAPTPKGEAAKRVSRLALERVKELQHAVDSHKAEAARAEGLAIAVTEELKKANENLKVLEKEAADKSAAAEKLTLVAKEREAEVIKLKEECAKADEAQEKATSLEHALAAARAEAAQLAAIRATADDQVIKQMSLLQSRIKGLESQLFKTHAEYAESSARAEDAKNALRELERLQETQQELEVTRSELAETNARLCAAIEQRDELLAKNTQLNAELGRSRRQMGEQGALLRRISEALALQRQSAIAATDLNAAREKKLNDLLDRSHAKVEELQTEVALLRKKTEAMAKLDIEKESLNSQLEAAIQRASVAEESLSAEIASHGISLALQRKEALKSKAECAKLAAQVQDAERRAFIAMDELMKLHAKSPPKKNSKRGKSPFEYVAILALVLGGGLLWQSRHSQRQ